MAESRKGKNGSGSGSGGTSAGEWIVAAVSGLLVLGAMGVLLHEAITERPTPPRIEVAVDSVARSGSGYVAEFTARNSGNQTAAGLSIAGELRSDTGSVERSEVTIDYLPARSTIRGGLFFREDPRRYVLEIRPLGYGEP